MEADAEPSNLSLTRFAFLENAFGFADPQTIRLGLTKFTQENGAFTSQDKMAIARMIDEELFRKVEPHSPRTIRACLAAVFQAMGAQDYEELQSQVPPDYAQILEVVAKAMAEHSSPTPGTMSAPSTTIAFVAEQQQEQACQALVNSTVMGIDLEGNNELDIQDTLEALVSEDTSLASILVESMYSGRQSLEESHIKSIIMQLARVTSMAKRNVLQPFLLLFKDKDARAILIGLGIKEDAAQAVLSSLQNSRLDVQISFHNYRLSKEELEQLLTQDSEPIQPVGSGGSCKDVPGTLEEQIESLLETGKPLEDPRWKGLRARLVKELFQSEKTPSDSASRASGLFDLLPTSLSIDMLHSVNGPVPPLMRPHLLKQICNTRYLKEFALKDGIITHGMMQDMSLVPGHRGEKLRRKLTRKGDNAIDNVSIGLLGHFFSEPYMSLFAVVKDGRLEIPELLAAAYDITFGEPLDTILPDFRIAHRRLVDTTGDKRSPTTLTCIADLDFIKAHLTVAWQTKNKELFVHIWSRFSAHPAVSLELQKDFLATVRGRLNSEPQKRVFDEFVETLSKP